MRKGPELIELIDAYIPTLVPGQTLQPTGATTDDPDPDGPTRGHWWERRLAQYRPAASFHVVARFALRPSASARNNASL
jgi:hypothetical protein